MKNFFEGLVMLAGVLFILLTSEEERRQPVRGERGIWAEPHRHYSSESSEDTYNLAIFSLSHIGAIEDIFKKELSQLADVRKALPSNQ